MDHNELITWLFRNDYEPFSNAPRRVTCPECDNKMGIIMWRKGADIINHISCDKCGHVQEPIIEKEPTTD